MNKKIKNFVRRNKTTIIAVTATAVPLIVLNVKFFQAMRDSNALNGKFAEANREWASRNGCHDETDHLNFSDRTMEEFKTGVKRIFDSPKFADLIVMSVDTYDKEMNS